MTVTRLTVFRLASAPIIGLAFVLFPADAARAAAFFLFAFAAGVGLAEGAAASSAAADRPFLSVADSAAAAAALIALLQATPAWAGVLAPPLLVMLLRDLSVAALAASLARRGLTLRSTGLVTWTLRLRFIALAALLGGPLLGPDPGEGLETLGLILLWLTTAATVWTGVRDIRAAVAAAARADASPASRPKGERA